VIAIVEGLEVGAVVLFALAWGAVLVAGLICTNSPWEWVMKCPRCSQYMRKQDPAVPWWCHCGWRE
jgi:hypothetical protein